MEGGIEGGDGRGSEGGVEGGVGVEGEIGEWGNGRKERLMFVIKVEGHLLVNS